VKRIAIAIAVLAFAKGASASPRYPDELRTALSLSKSPACTLCHAGDVDAGPAETPFAKSMKARGLRGEASDAGIDSTLSSALAAMRKDGVDSDGDGAQDLDELTWGGNPNVYDGSPATDLETTSYGCASGRSSSSAASWSLVLALAALFTHRARSRARRFRRSRGRS